MVRGEEGVYGWRGGYGVWGGEVMGVGVLRKGSRLDYEEEGMRWVVWKSVDGQMGLVQ